MIVARGGPVIRIGAHRGLPHEMKVLIIEDDPATVETLAMTFELRWPGVMVVSTTQGGKAREMVEKESPDVVVLDLGLPDVDGMDVLQELRKFSEAGIIILTARLDQASVVKGLGLGADDYMTKPFDPNVLLARTRSVLRRRQKPESSAGNEPGASQV